MASVSSRLLSIRYVRWLQPEDERQRSGPGLPGEFLGAQTGVGNISAVFLDLSDVQRVVLVCASAFDLREPRERILLRTAGDPVHGLRGKGHQAACIDDTRRLPDAVQISRLAMDCDDLGCHNLTIHKLAGTLQVS